MKQEFPKIRNYKVMVQCITYNQSKYIEDTLTGFAMQQTSFPFICCVYDDASTDGEQEVLRQWVDNHCNSGDIEVYDHPLTILLMAPDKDNLNCNYAIHLQKVNTWGKPEKSKMMAYWEKQCEYIALCEGDDFWIDSLKLQKQVDFMNTHKDFAAHTTNAKIIDRYGNQIQMFSDKVSRVIHDMNEIVIKRQFHTASVLLRARYYDDISSLLAWDTYIWCHLLTKGSIWYDDTISCIYRKTGEGITNATPKIKWIETVEKWSNILFTQYGQQYLSYTSAYISLTRDILNLLVLETALSRDDKAILRRKYNRYTNMTINIRNIPYLLRLLMSYMKHSIIRNKN